MYIYIYIERARERERESERERERERERCLYIYTSYVCTNELVGFEATYMYNTGCLRLGLAALEAQGFGSGCWLKLQGFGIRWQAWNKLMPQSLDSIGSYASNPKS